MRRIFLPDLCASCENRKRQLAGRRSDRASRCEHRKQFRHRCGKRCDKGHPGKCCGRGKSLPDYPSPQRQLRFLTPLVARKGCPQAKSGGCTQVTFSFPRNTFLCPSSSSGSVFSLPSWSTWLPPAPRN